jgi:hypothetical protein
MDYREFELILFWLVAIIEAAIVCGLVVAVWRMGDYDG